MMKEIEVLKEISLANSAVSKVSSTLMGSFKKPYSNIVFSGVGKSGLIEKVIRDLGVNVPVETAKANKLPDVNSKSLGIIVSYTGLTSDILDFYKYLQKRTKKIILITSNTYLAKNARQKGYLVIELSNRYTSANSFFLTFYSVIGILRKLGLLKISLKDITQSISKIKGFSKNFKSFQLSNSLKEKIPLIYTWGGYSSLGHLISSSFNLHAKHFCMKSHLPEADYDEVEALSYGDSKVYPIFIMPKIPKAKRIMRKVQALAKESDTFDLPSGSKLTQIIYTYMFFELVSERLAKIKDVDPYNRDVINNFKRTM